MVFLRWEVTVRLQVCSGLVSLRGIRSRNHTPQGPFLVSQRWSAKFLGLILSGVAALVEPQWDVFGFLSIVALCSLGS